MVRVGAYRKLVKPPRGGFEFDRDKDWKSFLSPMIEAAIMDEPKLEELRDKILELGGSEVNVTQREPHLDELLERGQVFYGKGSKRCPGEASQCHTNVAALWVHDRKQIRIVTGYALSKDGLWRQHSWALDGRDNKVIETTIPRLLYYGVVLSDGEAEEFAEFGGEDSCWS